ncbi:energy-coupling factor transporter transmembrane protein EcfT [Candidatus Woesearchaeota archaeon]|nr:energy-coupling factor transporter transmembrane protein EcfT [Candidatus Woesearchaeota archaeon]MCF7901206.1 energy-coupling factor transporter transmembrane protein EcfT [Candidatus Woesearchaeota archaeon]MCF8013699.1 energy-coupling factor transporter transmembrane protein EcfT [Candidatus Woesearchaeota archaeon]
MDSNIYTKRKTFFEGFSIAVLVLLIVMVVIISLTSNAPLFLVVVGFSPSLIAVVLSILVFEESIRGKVVLWIIPFIVLAVFFLVVTSQSILSSNLDVGTLLALNIMICVIYVSLALLTAKSIINVKGSSEKRIEKTHTPQTIRDFISSIEDKSKAINFVIGRVYNKYHGGSKDMREKLSIKSEWYNEFSDILKNEDGENKTLEQVKDKDKLVSMLYVVNKIHERLLMLNQSEKGIFGTKAENLKNLDRDRTGTQQIIEVMKKNDKDPVESYHKGALQMCETLKQRLNILIKK